ncbi:transient receptor potential cation channel subfamily M member 5-like [Tautogolabrus adspersus]
MFALSIYQHRELITVFHGDQEGSDDFDTVLLKALVGASKRVSSEASEYTEELKLAVAWNRVNIAQKELFNGDIQWKYEDLEDSMTDALINDKPQFVRLFCENGLNILDYLTYRRLESLYRSLSDSSLAYILLQRRLSERQDLPHLDPVMSPLKSPQSALSGAASAMELNLYEVSRLLWDLLGDVCQPFYYGPLGLDHNTSTRRALKHVNKMLLGECLYRDQRCLSPWSALFIWAVLQNRSEMADYFWEMIETENKLAMKELAQRFEDLAQGSHVVGGATCLQMATAADARLFFSHDGVQSLLSQIWWGRYGAEHGGLEAGPHILPAPPPLHEAHQLQVQVFLKEFFKEQEEEVKSVEVHHYRDTDSLEGNDATVSPWPTSYRTFTFKLKEPFIVSRWRQFWFAPVTSFLGNVLMYFLFLCLFAYVLLVDFKPPP